MSSKLKVILIGSILILLMLFSMVCLFIPKIEIKINGSKNQTIIVGEKYEELGGEAYLQGFFRKENLECKIIGGVNTNKIGKYIITYKAKYRNIFREVVRVIKVVDNIKPTITLNEEAKLCKKNNLLELNIAANDNYDEIYLKM